VVRAVGGMLEVHHSSPVVGEVLGHLAGSAGTPSTDIAGHGCVEGISANDVVKMCRRGVTRLHDGIEALGGQRRASKSKTCLNRGDERKSESKRLHLDRLA